MELKKILVIDKQNYFSKLLKQNFGCHFSIKAYKKLNDKICLDNLDIEFSFIIFAIYSESDLLDFIRINQKKANIIICTFNKRLFDIMTNCNIIYASETKTELLTELKNFLFINDLFRIESEIKKASISRSLLKF